jgi:GH15 family glucan-1,4-alpha-glucosidase
VELIDVAVEHRESSAPGLWEVRGEPRHSVHPKVMCWAALDYGWRLAEEWRVKGRGGRLQSISEEHVEERLRPGFPGVSPQTHPHRQRL